VRYNTQETPIEMSLEYPLNQCNSPYNQYHFTDFMLSLQAGQAKRAEEWLWRLQGDFIWGFHPMKLEFPTIHADIMVLPCGYD